MAPANEAHDTLAGRPEASESATAQLVSRARVMMMISALTTVLAIGAVVTVVGYRLMTQTTTTDATVTLPKGARVIGSAGSGGRLGVLLQFDGATELRVYDLKTMKETGRLRFNTEP